MIYLIFLLTSFAVQANEYKVIFSDPITTVVQSNSDGMNTSVSTEAVITAIKLLDLEPAKLNPDSLDLILIDLSKKIEIIQKAPHDLPIDLARGGGDVIGG